MQSSKVAPPTTKAAEATSHPEIDKEFTQDPTILVELTKPAATDQPNSEGRNGARRMVWLVTAASLLVVLVALVVAFPLVADDDENHDQTEASEGEQAIQTVTPPNSNEQSDPPSMPAFNSSITEEELPAPNIFNCKNNVSLFDLNAACESSVAAMAALHAGLVIPDHLVDDDYEYEHSDPVKQEGDFNVSTYFDVLNHLSLPKGEVLDYVYSYNFWGGEPILYVRGQNQAPFLTETSYNEASCNRTCPRYMDKIIPDKTPASYMQMAVLNEMGGRFYLWWHALLNDDKIICSEEMLDKIFQEFGTNSSYWESESQWYDDPSYPEGQEYVLDEQERQRLLDAGINPTVECDDDNADVVQVSVVTFTKWGGFYSKTYTIDSRDGASSKRIVDSASENLVPFSVPWIY